MKIFLTGGTGFVGSHVLKELVSRGHEVVAIRRKPGSSSKIEINQEFTWLLREYEDLTLSDFEGIEVLVHLASHSVQYPYDSLDECILQNVIRPMCLFQKAYDAGVRSFVVAGSAAEYGQSGERFQFIPPEAPLNPYNVYGTSKAMSYLAIREFFRERDTRVFYLRLFHLFGEGQNEDRLWPWLKKNALSGNDVELTYGEQVFDFTPVDFAAKIIVDYADSREISSAEFVTKNVGTGSPQRLKDFAIHWWKKFGAKGEIKFGAKEYRKNEVMRYVPKI